MQRLALWSDMPALDRSRAGRCPHIVTIVLFQAEIENFVPGRSNVEKVGFFYASAFALGRMDEEARCQLHNWLIAGPEDAKGIQVKLESLMAVLDAFVTEQVSQ